MQKFKSFGSAQRILNIQSGTYNTFYVQRHLLKRAAFMHYRAEAFDVLERARVAAKKTNDEESF